MPIASVVAVLRLVYMLLSGEYPTSFSSYLFGVLNSTVLLSIPFFLLLAEILNRSGGIRRLIVMVDAYVRNQSWWLARRRRHRDRTLPFANCMIVVLVGINYIPGASILIKGW